VLSLTSPDHITLRPVDSQSSHRSGVLSRERGRGSYASDSACGVAASGLRLLDPTSISRIIHAGGTSAAWHGT